MTFKGWEHSYLPIVFGDAPAGTKSLRVLSAPGPLAQLVPLIASTYHADARYAALTLLHYAVGAVTNLLIAPLALDGVTVEAAADQLGVVLETDGSLRGLWISSEYRLHSEMDVARLGIYLRHVLEPMVEAVHLTIRVGSRGINLVLLDAITRGCQRIERTQPIRPSSGWVDELLAAMGDTQQKARRTFTAQPDDGPPIAMTIPRVCCVLARHANAHSCPTCPQHSDEARRQYTEAWLRSLNEDGFRAEAGRPRVSKTTGSKT